MTFQSDITAKESIVTRRFLRRRFWIATLALLLALATSAGIAVVVLERQAARGDYFLAFHDIGNDAMRLELELLRLTRLADDEVVDRSAIRDAFVDLLTGYRAIIASAPDNDVADARSYAGGLHDHLDELGVEFGIDAGQAVQLRQLDEVSMPAALQKLWDRGEAPGNGESARAIETEISRLLKLTAPLVRGTGALNGAEREMIENFSLDRIRPMLMTMVKTLDAEIDRSGRTAILFVLVLSGLGIAASVLGFVAIFRPLERAVLASQAEIIAERDKAVAAEITKRNVLSAVSHELRTPMNGVLGIASLLIASDLKPEHRKHAEIIQSSGKTLLALVNNILDFSKMEAGILELEYENFSVEEVIIDVVTLLRGAANKKKLEMGVYFDPRIPEILQGDTNKLRQILINVVGNAIKFTDSGNVAIEVHEVSGSADPANGCELQIAVIDTGIGILHDKKDLIFERFTQVGESAKRKLEGTGLGLAISKQLVDTMGGRIWVESSPSDGATFLVRIPFSVPISSAMEPSWQTRAASMLTGHRVLLVDSDSITRRLYRLQLESCGMHVDDTATTQDGWDFLKRAAESRDTYAVSVIGHRTPEFNGIELTRRICADGRFAGLRVLLNPSAGNDHDGLINPEIDAIEEKPVLPHVLIGAICDLIGDAPAAVDTHGCEAVENRTAIM